MATKTTNDGEKIRAGAERLRREVGRFNAALRAEGEAEGRRWLLEDADGEDYKAVRSENGGLGTVGTVDYIRQLAHIQSWDSDIPVHDHHYAWGFAEGAMEAAREVALILDRSPGSWNDDPDDEAPPRD